MLKYYTYSSRNLSISPSDDGISPLNWLFSKCLKMEKKKKKTGLGKGK